MKLIIARHGEAAMAADDASRPLSRRGRSEMERISLFLGTSGVRVNHIFHSPRVRTKETAEILARSISNSMLIEPMAELDADSPLAPILSKIHPWDEDTLIVGHYPTVEVIVQSLLGIQESGRLPFTPGTAVCLERVGKTWRLSWMLQPELFGSSELLI